MTHNALLNFIIVVLFVLLGQHFGSGGVVYHSGSKVHVDDGQVLLCLNPIPCLNAHLCLNPVPPSHFSFPHHATSALFPCHSYPSLFHSNTASSHSLSLASGISVCQWLTSSTPVSPWCWNPSLHSREPLRPTASLAGRKMNSTSRESHSESIPLSTGGTETCLATISLVPRSTRPVLSLAVRKVGEGRTDLSRDACRDWCHVQSAHVWVVLSLSLFFPGIQFILSVQFVLRVWLLLDWSWLATVCDISRGTHQVINPSRPSLTFGTANDKSWAWRPGNEASYNHEPMTRRSVQLWKQHCFQPAFKPASTWHIWVYSWTSGHT